MSNKPHIQTELLRPTPDSLDDTNRAIETLLRKGIHGLKHSDLIAYAEHPDELVAICVARLLNPSQGFQRQNANGRVDIVEVLARRAVRDANAMGAVWTPFLDVLMQSIGTYDDVCEILDVKKRLGILRRWVRGVSDPQELVILAPFDSSAIRHIVLHFAKTIPESLIPKWIRDSNDALRLFENQTLLRRHFASILEHVLTLDWDFTYLKHALAEVPSSCFRSMTTAAVERVIRSALARHHYDALAAVLLRVPHLPGELIDEILEAEHWHDRLTAAAVLHKNRSPEVRRKLLAGEYGFSYALIDHPQIDGEVLRAAWVRAGDDKILAKKIIYRADVPDDVALAIVQTTDVWKHVPLSDAVLRPNVVLAAINRSNDIVPTFALRAFVEGRYRGHPLEWRIVEKIANGSEVDHHSLVPALIQRLEQGPLVLGADLVARLLRCADQQGRESLIGLLAQIHAPTEEHHAALADWEAMRSAVPVPISKTARGTLRPGLRP